jgi:RNA polymerase sigma factor (sigma-70 family)
MEAMDDSQLRHELEARHPQSFGWALCCCRQDRERAEEVLQRAYLKILNGAARYDGRGAFTTWLFAVIRRTALDERRRHWLWALRLLAYGRLRPVPATPSLEEALDRHALRQMFQTALQGLAPRQRQVLHLVFYQDLSLTEAATVMGISVGSARQHYDRGKAALRRRLATCQDFQEHAPHEPPGPRSAAPDAVL